MCVCVCVSFFYPFFSCSFNFPCFHDDISLALHRLIRQHRVFTKTVTLRTIFPKPDVKYFFFRSYYLGHTGVYLYTTRCYINIFAIYEDVRKSSRVDNHSVERVRGSVRKINRKDLVPFAKLHNPRIVYIFRIMHLELLYFPYTFS